MLSVTVIVAVAAVAQAHVQDSMDSFVDSITDRLYDRAQQVSPTHHLDMDKVTLGKPSGPSNLKNPQPNPSLQTARTVGSPFVSKRPLRTIPNVKTAQLSQNKLMPSFNFFPQIEESKMTKSVMPQLTKWDRKAKTEAQRAVQRHKTANRLVMPQLTKWDRKARTEAQRAARRHQTAVLPQLTKLTKWDRKAKTEAQRAVYRHKTANQLVMPQLTKWDRKAKTEAIRRTQAVMPQLTKWDRQAKTEAQRAVQRHQTAVQVMVPSKDDVTRRSAILGLAGTAVTPLLEKVRAPKAVDLSCLNARGMRVAITGSTSGIGLEAARLLYECGADVIMLNRNVERIQASIDAIKSNCTSPDAGTITGLECDLASLSSVNAAADVLANAKKPLDVLCLNAGVQFTGESTPRITEDGFETTLQVNYLAQLLLAERLLPTLARARRQRLASHESLPSRIVVTASDVHDPQSLSSKRELFGANAGLGALTGLVQTEHPGAGMVDGEPFDAHKMYKDTKLCDVMFMYELERRLEAAGVLPTDIAVNAFSPGLITQSGFFRHNNELIGEVFDFIGNKVTGAAETVRNGGAILANMVANPDYFEGSDGYWSNEVVGKGRHKLIGMTTSAESQDKEEAARLYDVSARLVGINANFAAKAAALRLRGVGTA